MVSYGVFVALFAFVLIGCLMSRWVWLPALVMFYPSSFVQCSYLLVMPCLSASVVVFFLATVFKIVISFVSPIFFGTLSWMAFTSCVAATTIASTLVNVGTMMYWCLKNIVSAPCTLLVFSTHILYH